jgi:S1-C subfamily serine protease
VWVLIVGVVLGGGAFGAYSVFFNDPRQVAQQPSQPREPRGPKLNRTPLLNPSTTQAAPVAPRPQEGAPLEDIVEYVKHAIVKIDIYDEFNNRGGLGSGFVIDKSGLVATNYHVVGAGIKADVLFNDGTRYGVEGYVALKPECDLAIVQLNGVPPNIAALELRTEDDPRTASKVIAIGHPHGYEFTVTDGIVSAVVDTPSLPQEAQQFLKGLLKQDKTDNRWIQHNAQIAQGNSGGPLLNPRGQVVGVNTWQNRDIGANFAIHAKHLKEALANRFPKVEALAQHRKREDAPAVIQSGRPEVTPKDFVAQFEAAAKTRWTPKSAEEYNLLKTMARTWTRAQFLLSLPPGRVPENYDGERNDWQQELAKAQQALVGISWNAETQIKPINHFALSAGLSIDQGVFVFATVKRTVPVGNSRWMQLVVEGGPAPLEFLLPLLKDDLAAPDGAKCLIVGVGSPPVNVVEGETQKQVPTVLCFTLLKLP